MKYKTKSIKIPLIVFINCFHCDTKTSIPSLSNFNKIVILMPTNYHRCGMYFFKVAMSEYFIHELTNAAEIKVMDFNPA